METYFSSDRYEHGKMKSWSIKKKSIIALIILILLIVYPIWKIYQAKTHILHFSQQIDIGMPVEMAELLARQRGLHLIKSASDSSQPGQSKFIVWDGWAFARWNCIILHKEGKVIKKELLYLD